MHHGPSARDCTDSEHLLLRRGAHLPYMGLEPVQINHKVCDTWPVCRQTYCHLPSLRALPPFDRYQVIVLGDRGIQVYLPKATVQ